MLQHKIANGLGMLSSFFERLSKQEQGSSCAKIISSRKSGTNERFITENGGTLHKLEKNYP